MPVFEWRGQKLRLDADGSQLTLRQAKVIKRTTGLRLVAFQTAVQQMVEAGDLDAELIQVFLWLVLDQNGIKQDISELEDVPVEEFSAALLAVTVDEVSVADPTAAAPGPDPALPQSSSDSTTPTSSADDPNICSSSPSTADSPL